MKKIYIFVCLTLMAAMAQAQGVPTPNRVLYWRGGDKFRDQNSAQNLQWANRLNWSTSPTSASIPSSDVTDGDQLVFDGASGAVALYTANNNVTFYLQYDLAIIIKDGASLTIPSGIKMQVGDTAQTTAYYNYIRVDSKYGISNLNLEKQQNKNLPTQLIMLYNGQPVVKAQNTSASLLVSSVVKPEMKYAYATTNPALPSDAALTYDNIIRGLGPNYGGFLGLPAGASLPVVLVDFNAVLKGSQVDLNWTTREEVNFSHFSIERSADGVNWTSIGTVAATGNGAPITRYSFIDPAPGTGVNYYRMRMVDLDGKYGISPIKAVRMGNAGVKMSVYPNPAVGQVNILVNQPGSDAYTVNIFNRNGQLVLSRKADGKSNVLSLDLSQLSAGTYLVDLQLADGSRQSRQLLVAAH